MKRFAFICAASASLLIAIAGCREQPPAESAEAAPEPTNGPTQFEPIANASMINYSIKGMSCEGCVAAITDKVKGIDGVLSCRVSLEGESAVIAVSDPELESEITESIVALGFKATPTAHDAEATDLDQPVSESDTDSGT